MQFANVWERVSDTVGDNIALINGDNELSWSQLDVKAAKIATILEEYGLKSDSKVGIYLHNSNEYLDCLLYTSPSPRDVVPSRMPSSA